MYITTHKNYPAAYSNNINSSLTFTGFLNYPLFRLEFVARDEFELESECFDVIVITGIYGPNLICGGIFSRSTLYYTAIGDSVTFSFVTDESQGYFGVLLNFTAIFPIHLGNNSNRAIPSKSLMYLATHQYYPFLYSTNINSSLTLTSIPSTSTITLDFLAREGFEIEAKCSDRVVVAGVSGYENNELIICGREFGQTTLFFRPIGEILTFTFITDLGLSFTGFIIKYTETPGAETVMTTRAARAAMIAAVSTASVLLVIVGVLAIPVAVYRKRLKKMTDTVLHNDTPQISQQSQGPRSKVDHQKVRARNQTRPLPQIHPEEDDAETPGYDFPEDEVTAEPYNEREAGTSNEEMYENDGYADRIERQASLSEIYDPITD
ncbi:uncharacterized protein [Watersipora subatra]|uniref:uncharacterized protein isoform X1 n=1 Tax=Watersipora subatra TaxID=2589382 RepID=UPI00355BAAD2